MSQHPLSENRGGEVQEELIGGIIAKLILGGIKDQMSPNHDTDVIPGPPNFDKFSDKVQEKSRDDKGKDEFKVTEPTALFINEESLVIGPHSLTHGAEPFLRSCKLCNH
jgi:hypothetical protein